MFPGSAMWHVLQFSDVLDFELSAELACHAPTVLWEPDRSVLPLRPHFRERVREVPGTQLSIRSFPLMRGYARAPILKVARTGPLLLRRLSGHCADAAEAVLVCTTPYFAPVAELWPGPVVYWITDLMIRYALTDPGLLLELDRRMCGAATLVCPASERIARYLYRDARCALAKIEVLPNATRAANLLPAPLARPLALPGEGPGEGMAVGPVAGVLGNLSDNMDWVFLEAVVERTPWLTWAFVGPASRPIEDREQARAYDAVRRHKRSLFLGRKAYGELCHFARAFTVAVLPYKRREPTFSGSSTRFYEHLAAGHPILATPCVSELLAKEPLLRLVPTAEAAVEALENLRQNGFEDGQRLARWEASRHNTWRVRAATMRTALAERLAPREAMAGLVDAQV